MKHRKWIVLLVVTCSLLGLIGCQAPEATDPELLVVNNFEKALGPIRMHDSFGIVDWNKDAKYVSQGEKSLKITPMADRKANLYVCIPFRASALEIDYTDISKMTEVVVDIYSDYEMTVSLGYYFGQHGDQRTGAMKYALNKGWNCLAVPIQHEKLSVHYSLEECYGLFLQFEPEASEQQASIYLDNVRIRKPAEPVVAE